MISVCMATYNGEKYLREQVDSILAQLGENDELVVSDDGSTDSTIDILKSYNDSRIKILKNKGNHGVNGNFENALSHANGDYIFLSDQDDVWLHDKVKECLKELANNDCIVHDAIVADSELNIISNSFFIDRNSGSGFWKNLYKNSYLGCCMAFRKEVLKYAFPYPDNLPIFQEGWVAMLAELNGKVSFVKFKGILFRRHFSNASCTANKSSLSFFQQITYRIKLLYLIAVRQYKISNKVYHGSTDK